MDSVWNQHRPSAFIKPVTFYRTSQAPVPRYIWRADPPVTDYFNQLQLSLIGDGWEMYRGAMRCYSLQATFGRLTSNWLVYAVKAPTAELLEGGSVKISHYDGQSKLLTAGGDGVAALPVQIPDGALAVLFIRSSGLYLTVDSFSGGVIATHGGADPPKWRYAAAVGGFQREGSDVLPLNEPNVLPVFDAFEVDLPAAVSHAWFRAA